MAPELYARNGQPRRKFALEEVRTLLHALGDPQLRFPSVLIAGTNGKGSTASTLASILTAAGLRTGLYTSPHLEKPNERIRVDREEIADGDFARLYFRVHDVAHEVVQAGQLAQLPSYFEILTAQAFLYFAESKVDIAVLEVGMGGRLDATNVVEPLISIVTDISLDHMEWLGPTITAIAREKAGILRRGGTMITLPQHPEVNRGSGRGGGGIGRARGESRFPTFRPPARGVPIPLRRLARRSRWIRHWVALTSSGTWRWQLPPRSSLPSVHRFPVTPAAIERGIRDTRWPGRLERMTRGGVDWILDVAHNPAGAWALRTGLREHSGNARSRGPSSSVACATSRWQRWRRFCFRSSSK